MFILPEKPLSRKLLLPLHRLCIIGFLWFTIQFRPNTIVSLQFVDPIVATSNQIDS